MAWIRSAISSKSGPDVSERKYRRRSRTRPTVIGSKIDTRA
jgi:hypothetical protein